MDGNIKMLMLVNGTIMPIVSQLHFFLGCSRQSFHLCVMSHLFLLGIAHWSLVLVNDTSISLHYYEFSNSML